VATPNFRLRDSSDSLQAINASSVRYVNTSQMRPTAISMWMCGVYFTAALGCATPTRDSVTIARGSASVAIQPEALPTTPQPALSAASTAAARANDPAPAPAPMRVPTPRPTGHNHASSQSDCDHGGPAPQLCVEPSATTGPIDSQSGCGTRLTASTALCRSCVTRFSHAEQGRCCFHGLSRLPLCD
jgi:hypothetical protein